MGNVGHNTSTEGGEVVTDPAKRFTVGQYCEALICALLVRKKSHLRFDDAETTHALGNLIAKLRADAKEAERAGDTGLTYDLFVLLNQISPNPNTGAYDGFWSALRDLQPAYAEVRNPYYLALEFKGTPSIAETAVKELPERWRKIVTQSAEMLSKAA
jgi:hypothetical protein